MEGEWNSTVSRATDRWSWWDCSVCADFVPTVASGNSEFRWYKDEGFQRQEFIQQARCAASLLDGRSGRGVADGVAEGWRSGGRVGAKVMSVLMGVQGCSDCQGRPERVHLPPRARTLSPVHLVASDSHPYSAVSSSSICWRRWSRAVLTGRTLLPARTKRCACADCVQALPTPLHDTPHGGRISS